MILSALRRWLHIELPCEQTHDKERVRQAVDENERASREWSEAAAKLADERKKRTQTENHFCENMAEMLRRLSH